MPLLVLLAACTPALDDEPTDTDVGHDADEAPDTTPDAPPSVTLVSPADGAEVAGIVALAAEASDDLGVVGVEFRVDGEAVASDAEGPEYTATWDACALSGQHTVEATATDASGQLASDAAVVTLTRAIEIRLIAPSGPVALDELLSADVSDDAEIARVEFDVDGVPIGEGSIAAEGDTCGFVCPCDAYALDWDTRAMAEGEATVTATAENVLGERASASATVIVSFDRDGDGARAEAYGGGDCDDTDPAVHPAAEEICGNGKDDDCDGTAGPCGYGGTGTLEDAWLVLEGEAFGDDAGYALAAGDLDGDGDEDLAVGAKTSGGTFGNEGAVYVVSLPASGTRSLADADARRDGVITSDYVGTTVAVADFDGDGAPDLLAGAPSADPGDIVSAGAIYVLRGPVTGGGTFATADATLEGDDRTSYAGRTLAVGDVDGDGIDDVATNGTGDFAWIVAGGALGTISLTDADARIDSGLLSGGGVAIGDLDGDGLGDLALGVPFHSGGAEHAGGVYVLASPLAGDLDPEEVGVVLEGIDADDGVGQGVAVGDVDGDGVDDVVASCFDYAADDRGAAWVVLGPIVATQGFDEADGEILGDASEGIGIDLALGDLDDDRALDLLVNVGGSDAALFRGPLLDVTSTADAYARFAGLSAPGAVAMVDGDGDGTRDVVVGAGNADTTTDESAGAVYLHVDGPGW